MLEKIFKAILPYEDMGLGEVFMETPFVLLNSSDWVKGARVPDVMYVDAQRLKAYRSTMPDWKHKPLVLVPDWVIEVLSESNSYSDTAIRVNAYLKDGVKLVWIIDPKSQTVVVHTLGITQLQTYSEDEAINADEVLPDFTLKVSALFGD